MKIFYVASGLSSLEISSAAMAMFLLVAPEAAIFKNKGC